MPVIVCPRADCRKTYRVSEDALGRDVKCKKCGQTFAATPTDTASSLEHSSVPNSDASESAKRVSLQTSSFTSGHPDHIGRFVIRKKLGHGAFGNVYRAHDPQLDREVAIKVPQPGLLASSEFVRRFLREAKAAARLNHPHIVPVYDAGQDGAQSYIASAFIDGEPLSDKVEEFAGSYRRIAEVIRQLAEALYYAHSQKIIHRDIKPHNVMIDANSEPHLMDFGLAQLENEAEKLTHDGTLMGTPAYMSPEQAAGKTDDVNAASDQYSLGVVLFELLTGETPFAGAPSVVIYNILNQSLPRPRLLNSQIPRDLETICLKALSRESAGRYQHCGELAADLDRWLHDQPIAARRASIVERTFRWCRRNPLVATLSATVFASILLGGGMATSFGIVANQRATALESALSDVVTQKNRADEKTDEARKALVQAGDEKARAEKNAAEATKALVQMLEERARAEKNAADASKAMVQVEEEKARTEKSAAEATRSAELAERRQYDQEMVLIQQDWEAQRYSEVRRRLDALVSREEKTRSATGPLQAGDNSRETAESAAAVQGIDAKPRYLGLEWHYWDRRVDGRQRRVFQAGLHSSTSVVRAVLLHPDGKRVLLMTGHSSIGHQIELCNVSQKIASTSLEGVHLNRYELSNSTSLERYFQFTPDGEQLMGLNTTWTDAKPGEQQKFPELIFWNLRDLSVDRKIALTELMTPSQHDSWHAAFSLDRASRLIAIGGGYQKDAFILDINQPLKPLRLGAAEAPRNTKTSTRMLESRSFIDRVTSFSGNGQRCACLNADLTISVWDVKTGKEFVKIGKALSEKEVEQVRFKPHSNDLYVEALCLNSTGTMLGVNRVGGIEFWDLQKRERIGNPLKFDGGPHRVLSTPNESEFLLVTGIGTIYRIAMRNGTIHEDTLAQIARTTFDATHMPGKILVAASSPAGHSTDIWEIPLSDAVQHPVPAQVPELAKRTANASDTVWGHGPDGTDWQLTITHGETVWTGDTGDQTLQGIEDDLRQGKPSVFWNQKEKILILKLSSGGHVKLMAWRRGQQQPIWMFDIPEGNMLSTRCELSPDQRWLFCNVPKYSQPAKATSVEPQKTPARLIDVTTGEILGATNMDGTLTIDWDRQCLRHSFEKVDAAQTVSSHLQMLKLPTLQLLTEAEIPGHFTTYPRIAGPSIGATAQYLWYVSAKPQEIKAGGTAHLGLLRYPTLEHAETITVSFQGSASNWSDATPGTGLVADRPRTLCVSWKTRTCAVGTMKGQLYLFSLDDAKQMVRAKFRDYQRRLDELRDENSDALFFSPDGERVATVSRSRNRDEILGTSNQADQALHLWDVRTGDRVLIWPIPEDMLQASGGKLGQQNLRFSDDGYKIVMTQSSGKQQIWLDCTPLAKH